MPLPAPNRPLERSGILFERRLCRRNPDLREAGRSTSNACDDRRRGPSRPPPKLIRRGRLDLPAGFLVRLDGFLEVTVLLAAEEAQAVVPPAGLLGPRQGVKPHGGPAHGILGGRGAAVERPRLAGE